MSINSLTSHENISEFIDNAINDIYDQEIWERRELLEVCEVTYSYDEHTNINTRLFCVIGGLDLIKFKQTNSKEIRETMFHQAYEIAKNTLTTKKNQIEIVLSDLEAINTSQMDEGSSIKTDIFIKALIEKKKLIDYAILALPLERQKAGFDNELNSKEFIKLNNDIHELDKELFGGDIKDNPDEVEKLYTAYREKYNQNKENLSLEEQLRMEEYFSLLQGYLPEEYEYSPPSFSEKMDTSLLQKSLPRSEYIPLFNEVLKGLKDSDHIAQVNKNVNSVCDTQEGIDFPGNKQFDYLTLERILTLMNHECEAHCISDYNSKSIIGKIRGAGSTKKDEGVAVLMEQILFHGRDLYTQIDGKTIIDISKVAVNPAYIQILMCEILDNNQLLDFLELSHKIIGGNISPKSRYDRLKRNNYIYGQHKDVLYLRGLFQAIDEINKYILSDGKQGISMQDMFIGKVSFEDTSKFKRLRELSTEISENPGDSHELLQPKFIAETILYLLKRDLVTQDGKISKEFSQSNFLAYLQEKYPIIDISDDVFNNITYTTKKSVYQVLQILTRHNEKE